MARPINTIRNVLNRCIVDENGCWIFTGCLGRDGYGRVSFRGRTTLAHRFAYTELVGPIPDDRFLDHLCRVHACLNPEHLEPVTNQENLLRGDTLSAKWAARSHCQNGHPYTPENTYYSKHDGRRCRTCEREERREARARQST